MGDPKHKLQQTRELHYAGTTTCWGQYVTPRNYDYKAVTPGGWHFHFRRHLHFYPGEGEVAADDAAAEWCWWWLASPSDSACTMRGSALLPSRNSSSVRRSSWFLSIWSKILSTRFCGVLSSSAVGCCPCKKQVRKCTQSKRDAEAPSLNHSCCGKALSFTYSQCVSVALVI